MFRRGTGLPASIVPEHRRYHARKPRLYNLGTGKRSTSRRQVAFDILLS